MKKLLILGVGVLLGVQGFTQPIPPPAATQAEVNAGTVRSKFVSPATIANYVPGGSSGALVNGTNYSTLEDAAANQFPGCIIYLNGIVTVSNKVTFTNCTIEATGATLRNYVTNTTAGGLPFPFLLYDNSSWNGGTITNMYPSAYQGVFGFDQREGDPLCTNMVVKNVKALGNTDAVFMHHTNAAGLFGSFDSCQFISRYDTLVSKAVGARWAYTNCLFQTDGSFSGGVARDLILNGSHYFNNCRFIKLAMPAATSSSFQISGSGAISTTELMTNIFDGCYFYGVSTNAARIRLFEAGGNTTRTNITALNRCRFEGRGSLVAIYTSTRNTIYWNDVRAFTRDSTNMQVEYGALGLLLNVRGLGNFDASRMTNGSGKTNYLGALGFSVTNYSVLNTSQSVTFIPTNTPLALELPVSGSWLDWNSNNIGVLYRTVNSNGTLVTIPQ